MGCVEGRGRWRTRFAPAPTGWLHIGHARAALVASLLGEWPGVAVHLRVDDIDPTRCRPHFVDALAHDLHALGLQTPPWVWQSRCLEHYHAAFAELRSLRVVYPCTCSRRDLAQAAQPHHPRTPDGAPRYRHHCRDRYRRDPSSPDPKVTCTWRLDAERATALVDPLAIDALDQNGQRQREAVDLAAWGDVVVWSRNDRPTYHLAVVVDDALRGVSLVTRGEDLRAATSIHRTLQALLGLPAPVYHHHPLVTDAHGKLSKRDGATRLATALAQGVVTRDALWADAWACIAPMLASSAMRDTNGVC